MAERLEASLETQVRRRGGGITKAPTLKRLSSNCDSATLSDDEYGVRTAQARELGTTEAEPLATDATAVQSSSSEWR